MFEVASISAVIGLLAGVIVGPVFAFFVGAYVFGTLCVFKGRNWQ